MPPQGVSALSMYVLKEKSEVEEWGWGCRIAEEVVLEMKQENEMYHDASVKLNGTCIFYSTTRDLDTPLKYLCMR